MSRRPTLSRISRAIAGALLVGAACSADPGATSGNADGSGTTGTPNGAGVVADGVCYPLCASASTDTDGDGWGYENQMSCVVADSPAAVARTPCTVGGAVPTTVGPPPGSPGVVVEKSCVGICTAGITDPDGDGWGWQFDATCVIPGSAMATASAPCMTGAPVPGADPTGSPGRLVNEICTPYCRTSGADPDGDGWGYELGATCLVMGSVPATTMGIDCVLGQDDSMPPNVINPNPPAGAVTKPAAVSSKGFFVANGRLYDKFGNDFIIRGVNNPHIWFDVSNQYLAYQALDNIAGLGANTIRIVWKTSGSASNLRRVVRRVVELKMVPMVELHDVTGGTVDGDLLQMAAYYTSTDVKQVLLDYETFLLVNVANEWSGVNFRGAYQAAVAQMRAAGINHTLVIDANDFGQNADAILTDGGALLTSDPQHNLLFSVHMYEQYAATTAGRMKITSTLEQAKSKTLPLVIGEFSSSRGSTAVDVAQIMSESLRLAYGYIAWSWKGNDASLAALDMALDWEGQQLTPWGQSVVQGASGITQTGKRASLYAP